MSGTGTLGMLQQERSGWQRKISSFGILVNLVVLGMAVAAWAKVPEPYAIEPVSLQPSTKLSKAMADALDPQGSVLYTSEDGVRMNVCEIFWAKAVAEQDVPAKSSSLVYGKLKPGALVGVVHFLPGADEEYRKDNKDQKLKPGYYTMRYGILQAGIGEHGPEQGDFVLLSPAALDRDPARVIPASELIRLSRVASRTKEPAVMNLIEVTVARKEFPGVTTDYAGTCVMQVKLHVKPKKGATSQDLALALVVMTPLVEGEGS
jgi:hypothetical protein